MAKETYKEYVDRLERQRERSAQRYAELSAEEYEEEYARAREYLALKSEGLIEPKNKHHRYYERYQRSRRKR